MERKRLEELLVAVRRGDCTVDDALERLRGLPFEDLGFAQLDHHRALRNGFPEVILGEGKSPDQVIAIAERMAATGGNVLVTRIAPDVGTRLVAEVPGFEYHPTPHLALRRQAPGTDAGRGTILVVSAGTADVPVAEEAAISADVMGNRVERLYDVGVAGLHRLLERRASPVHAYDVRALAGRPRGRRRAHARSSPRDKYRLTLEAPGDKIVRAHRFNRKHQTIPNLNFGELL